MLCPFTEREKLKDGKVKARKDERIVSLINLSTRHLVNSTTERSKRLFHQLSYQLVKASTEMTKKQHCLFNSLLVYLSTRQ